MMTNALELLLHDKTQAISSSRTITLGVSFSFSLDLVLAFPL